MKPQTDSTEKAATSPGSASETNSPTGGLSASTQPGTGYSTPPAAVEQPWIARRQPGLLPLLHGLILLLALTELGLGWSEQLWPQAERYAETLSWVHHSLGISLAMLVVLFLIGRLLSAPSRLPQTGLPWLGISVRISLFLLYAVLILALLTGYLALLFAGGDVPFWILSLPHWGWIDPELSDHFSHLHGLVGIVLAGVLALYLLLRAGLALVRAEAAATRPPSIAAAPEPAPETPTGRRNRLAGQLWVLGIVAFWLQLGLGVTAVLLQIVTASSKSLSAMPAQVIAQGLDWTDGLLWGYLATIVLAFSIVAFFVSARTTRRLRRGAEPQALIQRRVGRIISSTTFGSTLGLLLAICGTGFSIAVLIAKTVSQPPGIAITDPESIVRAVDVFVLLANFNVIIAHFVGILTSLGMRNRFSQL
jgi:cytochrome b561